MMLIVLCSGAVATLDSQGSQNLVDLNWEKFVNQNH